MMIALDSIECNRLLIGFGFLPDSGKIRVKIPAILRAWCPCLPALEPIYGPNPSPQGLRARSSAGEHLVDIEGVTGSIPVAPTIQSYETANPGADFR